MDLNNLTIFQMANNELNYLTERQKVLAANLANSNTPGYVAKDLEKPQFAEVLKNTVSLARTNEKHMSGVPDNTAAGGVYTPKPDYALTIDGNGVIIEDQLNKVAETKGDYNRMLTIYTSYRNMLKTANTQAGS